MTPRLALLHFRMQALRNMREPGTIVPPLVFPTMFFLFFGVSSATSTSSANLVMASYATYAFMGAAFGQFTGGIVQGRLGSWDEYLRTLPASYSHRIIGWSLAGMTVGLLAFVFVILTALLTIDVSAGPAQWFFLAFAVLYGSVPVAMLAASLGYWLSARAAVPIATLVYFGLTYAGGIWTSPDALPGWLQTISPYLPTRMWAELSWASIQRQPWQLQHAFGLAAYTLLFGLLAVWGYRREDWRRHH